jgi:hypothetical protein
VLRGQRIDRGYSGNVDRDFGLSIDDGLEKVFHYNLRPLTIQRAD